MNYENLLFVPDYMQLAWRAEDSALIISHISLIKELLLKLI